VSAFTFPRTDKTYKVTVEFSFYAEDETEAQEIIKYQIRRPINTDLVSVDDVTMVEVPE